MDSAIGSTSDQVRWERSGDADQTWFSDSYMCPVHVCMLAQFFYPYTTQAFSRNQREF